MFSCGAIVTGPLVGYLTIYMPYFYPILISLIVYIEANLMYGFASGAWMVIVSRILLGTSFKILFTVSLTYIANKEPKYDRVYKEHRVKHVRYRVLKKEGNNNSSETTNQREEGSNVKKSMFILLTFSILSFRVLLAQVYRHDAAVRVNRINVAILLQL